MCCLHYFTNTSQKFLYLVICDSGKSLLEVGNRVPCRQNIKLCLNWHPCPREHRCSSHYFRIT